MLTQKLQHKLTSLKMAWTALTKEEVIVIDCRTDERRKAIATHLNQHMEYIASGKKPVVVTGFAGREEK